MKSGQRQELEKLLPEERCWHVTVNPVFSDSGRVIGTIEISQDITERKRADQALRKSKDILEKTFSSLDSAVFILDAQKPPLIIDCNPAATIIFGYGKEEMLGRTTEFLHISREKLLEFQKALNQSIQEQGGLSFFEFKMQRKDGQIFPSEHSVRSLKDDKGQIIGWVSVIRDITERKQSEQALRETTDLLETVFEHTHMLVAYLDPQFNFVRVNCAYAEADEREPSFFVGRNHFDLYPNAENEAIFRKVVETGMPYFTHVKPFEYAGHPERGVTYWNWSLVPVKQQDGAACGLILTLADVTEQKRAEQALRESEERFRRIFEEGPIGIATSGADFRFTRANAAFCEMMGRTESELRELTFRDITYPEDLCRDIEPIQRLLRGEIPIYRTEKRYVGKDTEIVWGYMTATAVKNEAGQFQCFLVMVEDITERKRAEEAMRESEEKFRSLAEQSPNIIFINKKGNFVYANKKCEEVMGYKREELCSPDFDFLTLIAPESVAVVKESFARHSRGEEVQPYDHTIINKDGKRIEAINASKLIQYEGGTAILGVVTDITERKRAEQALRESEERLKILFESAPDAIYLIDFEGRFIDGNRAAEELIGFAKDEVIGKSLAEMGLLSDGQLSKAKANLKKVVAGKLSGPIEYILKRKDDTYVTVEVRTFPVKIGGKILTLGIARDITGHKRTEKELLEHHAKLKSLASQLSLTEERERHRLATDLHDQISQSLVISKIKLDQLRKSSTSNEFNKSLEDICNCLGRIIDDTRTLTFDLSYPILYELGFEAAVAEWLTDQIQEKHGIKTEFEDDGHQKPLDDDIRVLLFRNVRELLINVIKHAQANKVIVSIRRVNEHINVSVEDDGVGFDPIEVTSMATKRAEFGLFSIRERLEQLGGLIEIDSDPGRGSKITMTAPLKYDNSTDGTQK
jgi:PAS domain S-box-containing protein